MILRDKPHKSTLQSCPLDAYKRLTRRRRVLLGSNARSVRWPLSRTFCAWGLIWAFGLDRSLRVKIVGTYIPTAGGHQNPGWITLPSTQKSVSWLSSQMIYIWDPIWASGSGQSYACEDDPMRVKMILCVLKIRGTYIPSAGDIQSRTRITPPQFANSVSLLKKVSSRNVSLPQVVPLSDRGDLGYAGPSSRTTQHSSYTTNNWLRRPFVIQTRRFFVVQMTSCGCACFIWLNDPDYAGPSTHTTQHSFCKVGKCFRRAFGVHSHKVLCRSDGLFRLCVFPLIRWPDSTGISPTKSQHVDWAQPWRNKSQSKQLLSHISQGPRSALYIQLRCHQSLHS